MSTHNSTDGKARVSLALLVAGVVVSALLGLARYSLIHADADEQFHHAVALLSREISDRFRISSYGLFGARGLYAADRYVGGEQFARYVQSRDIPVEFPGIRGIGFIERIERMQLEPYLADARVADRRDFAIRTLGDSSRHDLFVIRYIEPESANKGARGLDVGSEANRRAAAEKAIDSGVPTLTATIRLVQDSRSTPGALLYVPVYTSATVPDSIEERRASLIGLVYAPIVFNELLGDLSVIAKDHFTIELVDATDGQPAGEALFVLAPRVQSSPSVTPAPGGFDTVARLKILDREWALKVASTQAFDSRFDRFSPWAIFIGGSLISLLFAALVQQQERARQRAETMAQAMTKELQRDKARSHDFSLSASDWFWETDSEQRFVYFSDNFTGAYKRRPDELLGRTRRELLQNAPDMDPGVLACHLAQLDAHEPFRDFQYRMMGNDGQMQWISVSGVPHFEPDGRFAGYRGTGAIITEKKQRALELEQQKRRLNDVLDGENVGSWEWNIQTGEISINERWAEMLGYSRAELEPVTNESYASLVHPDDWPEAENRVQAHFAGRSRFYSCELRLRRKDGAWAWILSTGRVSARSGDGSPVLMAGTHRDVTGEKTRQAELDAYRTRLEQLVESRTSALAIAKDEAEAASRAKSTFLSIASHELRTPLNGIMGTIALASKRTDDAKLLDYLQKAERSSRQLLAIINDVLEISRIESARLSLAVEYFDLGEIRTRVLDSAESIAKSRAIELTYKMDKSLAMRPLIGDATRLTQILHNLVGNALKFTPEGTVTVAVSERPCATEGVARLRFEVRDTGIGIRAEDLARIFEPFEQADNSTTRKYGGTGLGLTLCKRLVEAMQGNIGVESEWDSGSLFWFEVQFESPKNREAAEPDPAWSGNALKASHAGANILVVEDDALNQEITTAVLEAAGLNVYTASDGLEAIECIKTGVFDLILMDMNMPNMVGIEATYQIRLNPRYTRTPIIALTANSFVEDRDACIQAGMNDHLSKPVMPDVLYKTILRWLRVKERALG
ncbi:MAG: CHASE domain-containing protein [Rhodocyclaceae bacterium]|nr:CHASE domain-containing protein [Rhodocyclaceae bacterium]MBX3669449.1 CHASE domain-containing protein [Rhodocyclaceae bacterium]